MKPKRRNFLVRMFKEVMRTYASHPNPMETWSQDEKEFLPLFMDALKRKGLILDLSGGYGRVTPHLMKDGNHVLLADLSKHQLRIAKKNLKGNVDFVQVDMFHLPFTENVFDKVWLTQAFEYVSPDMREDFLLNLRRIIKKEGVFFVNISKVPNECSILSYIKNYLYWKFVKREPIVWGEYIYKLQGKYYEGWHYHSEVVFFPFFIKRTMEKVERIFEKTIFNVLKSKYYKNDYLTYLLEAS